MRDIIAALLRSRGYTHDDERDPNDMYWQGPEGVRPILVCVAYEMSRETPGGQTPGWDTYSVSVARKLPEPPGAAPTPIARRAHSL